LARARVTDEAPEEMDRPANLEAAGGGEELAFGVNLAFWKQIAKANQRD
jgi:hypothetical protein